MKRRDFLKSTGAAAAVAATPVVAGATQQVRASPTQSAAGLRWALCSDWPATVAGPADIAHRLALRINDLSGGEIHVSLPHAERALETPRNAEALSGQSLHATLHHGSESKPGTRHPALAYFSGLPGSEGLSASELETWIGHGGGQALWDELGALYGYKPLLAGHLGEQTRLFTKRQLADANDLRGLRIAASGPIAEVAKALGSDPVDVAPRDILQAIEEGTIEALEISPVHALALGIARHFEFSHDPLLQPLGEAVALRVPIPTWEALDSPRRAIVASAAAEYFKVTLSEARFANATATSALEYRFAVKTVPLPAALAMTERHICAAVIADLASRDALSTKINASYIGFRNAISGRIRTHTNRPMA